MADIKTKSSKKGTIKTINKQLVGTQRIKDRLVETKERVRENTEEKGENGTNYAMNKISNAGQKAPYKMEQLNRYGKNNIKQTKENIIKANEKVKYIKKRNHAKSVAKKIVNNSKVSVTSANKIKTAEVVAKNTKEMTKATLKASQKMGYATEKLIQKTVNGTKKMLKGTISSVKAIIAGTKALISALIAGGSLVLIMVILICLIGMMCNSIFGIFFSSQKTSSSSSQSVTMSNVISDLNTEFMGKITKIQKDNPYDEYDITGSRSSWKDVLTIYSVKVKSNDKAEIVTLDDNKVKTLKDIFWKMNNVSFTKETETKENDKQEKTTYTKLHIKITGKTVKQMQEEYNFNAQQILQVAELQKDEFNSLWSAVIYGSSVGNSDIVEVARSQIGNVGGEPYWSWYGFKSRVEWCACFVSWCANECGYIESGVIPKFAGCQAEGVEWFKACGLWKDGGYIPKTGDIIFFDWADKHDGHSDHVGIVEKVENDRVYTIEGNSSDSCRQRDYDINDFQIQGYGTPMY